jgi:hypothetical protein
MSFVFLVIVIEVLNVSFGLNRINIVIWYDLFNQVS